MEYFANNASTFLVGSVTASDLILTVESGLSFPTHVPFRIRIDSEIMLVTFVNGYQWTVLRGQEGSEAVYHSSSSTIYGVMTAAVVTELVLDHAKRHYEPPRVLAPRHCYRVPLALCEDLESWTNTTPTTTEPYVGRGKGSRQITSTSGAATTAVFTPGSPLAVDWDATPQIEALFWIDDVSKVEYVVWYFYNGTKYWQTTHSSSGQVLTRNGWNLVRFRQGSFTAGGGAAAEDWANITTVRVKVDAIAGENLNVYVAYIGAAKPRGIVLLDHDDGYDSWDEAWAIEEQFGFRSTGYINTSEIGNTNRSTWEKMWNAYVRGHDICNHSADHTSLSTLDATNKRLKIQAGYNALWARGFARSHHFFAAPSGEGSALITAACVDTGRPFALTNRAAAGSSNVHYPYPPLSDYVGIGYNSISEDTMPDPATLEGWIDEVNTYGTKMHILTHELRDSGSTTALRWSPAKYERICAYLAAQDNLDVMTISEFYRMAKATAQFSNETEFDATPQTDGTILWNRAL